jgi:hypothetical protein
MKLFKRHHMVRGVSSILYQKESHLGGEIKILGFGLEDSICMSTVAVRSQKWQIDVILTHVGLSNR